MRVFPCRPWHHESGHDLRPNRGQALRRTQQRVAELLLTLGGGPPYRVQACGPGFLLAALVPDDAVNTVGQRHAIGQVEHERLDVEREGERRA